MEESAPGFYLPGRLEVIYTKKTIGILLLVSWIPFVLAMAFPESSTGWYTITGLMWVVFGTWAGILLVRSK
jgi:hypothetical protein